MHKDAEGLEREHDQRLVELQSLFELSKTLNSSRNLKSILDTLLLTPMGRMLIAQGAILVTIKDHVYDISTVKGLPRELNGRRLAFTQTWTGPATLSEIDDPACREFLEQNSLRLVCPIHYNDKCLGLLVLGAKLGGQPFSADDLEYLSSLANLAAPAVENSRYIRELQDVNRQLDKRIQELNTLFEISRELNTTLDRDKIANTLAYAVMGELMVRKCLIYLIDSEAECTPQVYKGFRSPEEVAFPETILSRKCLQEIQEGALVEELEDDELRAFLEKREISVVVPMMSQDALRGMLMAGGRFQPTPFTREDLSFLTTLGNAAMTSLENARLFIETVEKERLEEELTIARDIQKQLLPEAPPESSSFDFAGLNVSSLQVGGDYYDFIGIDEHRVAFAIGDVSGKGVGASLLMANLQASLHALIYSSLSLSEIVYRINNIIYRNTPVDKFITFFLGILDTEKHEFTYVNAGHNPPYQYTADGELETLETGGLILGMMPDMPYQEETRPLSAGEWLLLFTDGVNEAMNEADDEFEEWRIEKFIRESKKTTALKFIHDLEKEVYDFCGDAPQSDDITILAVHAKRGASKKPAEDSTGD